jgi:predicted Rossmann-fold nucleotide-binding protein
MINKVKAVIVIGGNTGTLDEESLASQNKIPVIPIAITEGAAYKIWEAYKDTKNSQVFNEWQFDKNLFEQLNDTSLPTASEAAISLLKHSIQLT